MVDANNQSINTSRCLSQALERYSVIRWKHHHKIVITLLTLSPLYHSHSKPLFLLGEACCHSMRNY